MILFLDDNPNRTKKFKSSFPSARTTETAQGMINLLKEIEEVDQLFLDHDLGGETFCDSGKEDCGMEVVRWMVENKPLVKDIIVHSLNGPAAENMVSDLKAAGYNAVRIPFINLPL